jgi:GNAT superfamily N-acetyltransferase
MEGNNSQNVINMKNTKNGTIFTHRNGTQWLVKPNGTHVRVQKQANKVNKVRQANKVKIIGPGKWIVHNPTRYQNVENLLSQNLGSAWVGKKLGKVYNRNNYENYVVLNKNSKVLAYSIVNKARPTLAVVAFGTNRSTRGTGIGRFLMNKIKNNARNTGYRRIILNSVPTATGFYNKMGFTAPYSNTFRQFNLITKIKRKPNNPRKRPRNRILNQN